MSLIDWSDPDEMIGLLLEYVADEARAERGDPERAVFLRSLSEDLEELSGEQADASESAEAMAAVRAAQPGEFLSDPVITHVEACIEELRRIAANGSSVHTV
jgi:hypothetical protein